MDFDLVHYHATNHAAQRLLERIEGDNLWKIAAEFKMKVEAIIKLNNLPSTVLSRGQKITVQNYSGTKFTHVVSEPSTLQTIDDSAKRVKQLVSNGSVLLDIEDNRYIRSNDLYFPCLRKDKNQYIILTTITWDMVENGVDLQQRIDTKYS